MSMSLGVTNMFFKKGLEEGFGCVHIPVKGRFCWDVWGGRQGVVLLIVIDSMWLTLLAGFLPSCAPAWKSPVSQNELLFSDLVVLESVKVTQHFHEFLGFLRKSLQLLNLISFSVCGVVLRLWRTRMQDTGYPLLALWRYFSHITYLLISSTTTLLGDNVFEFQL